MALSKAKTLQEAEKSAAQGKISQAIKLYLEILEYDPSDLSLYNTVGDLCIRDRNITEGLRQFHRLAEAYVQQGFNVKAIAIYRKISKIEPTAVEVLLKLAELYQLQGLGREAREQYLQAAEFLKKRNQIERTVEVLRRLTMLDPENTNFRNRLAAECEHAGKREEAVVAYIDSAEASLRRGDLASAGAVLKKAADLDPNSSKVQLLRARVAISRQEPEEAEKIIEGSPGLEAEPSGKQILLDTYLSLRKLPQAERLVREVFRANPSDFTPVSTLADLCIEKDETGTALELLAGVSDRLIRMHSAGPLIESLRRVGKQFPDLFRLSSYCTGFASALPTNLPCRKFWRRWARLTPRRVSLKKRKRSIKNSPTASREMKITEIGWRRFTAGSARRKCRHTRQILERERSPSLRRRRPPKSRFPLMPLSRQW